MATGISKREQLSEDSITAFNKNTQEQPLPDHDQNALLSYANKATEEEVLRSPERSFIRASSEGSFPISHFAKNSFVLSDNSDALHRVIDSPMRASLIYLDPPYGTGFDFQSRDLEHAYNDHMGQACYVEFMRRRLILMRECMSDDASIYVHIGHQMVAHLKVVMDEVFGADRFRNLITRRKCSSKNFTQNQYSNLNDFILFYSKGKNFKWNRPGITPDQAWIDKEYTKTDDIGRRFKLVPIHAPGTRNGETGQPWRDMMPPPGKHWQYVPSKLEEFEKNGDIHWSRTGNPRRKVYWSNDRKLGMSDYWEGFRDAHHQSIKITGYPTEKNLQMMEMIIGASSDPGDLVIDPFCGSGTTLEAARNTGRDWLGFDASFTAAKATLKRLRHGTEAMGDYVNKKKVLRTENPVLSSALQTNDLSFIFDERLLEDHKVEIDELSAL